MIVPVMAISNLVLTQQIYSEETNGAHAHYREPVPLSSKLFRFAKEIKTSETSDCEFPDNKHSRDWQNSRMLLMHTLDFVSNLQTAISRKAVGTSARDNPKKYCECF